jgi:hypothetical protein
LGGIPPIRLYSFARLLGDEGRGHDHARDPLVGEFAIQAISARASLVSDHESGGVTVKSSKQFLEVGLSRADLADIDDIGRAIGAGVGHSDAVLVDVQTDEKGGRLCHG